MISLSLSWLIHLSSYFSPPCLAEEGSDKVMGTWHSARVKPPQLVTLCVLMYRAHTRIKDKNLCQKRVTETLLFLTFATFLIFQNSYPQWSHIYLFSSPTLAKTDLTLSFTFSVIWWACGSSFHIKWKVLLAYEKMLTWTPNFQLSQNSRKLFKHQPEVI